MTSWIRRLLPSPTRNADLLGLFALAAVIAPLVPLEHPLARPDLVPWMTTFLVAIAWLRGDTLGQKAPPSLTPRSGGWTEVQASRLAPAAAPLALLAWYDTARLVPMPWDRLQLDGSWAAIAFQAREYLIDLVWFEPLAWALGATIGVAALAAWGRPHGLTAWDPHHSAQGDLWWLPRLVVTLGSCVALGLMARLMPWKVTEWLPVAALLGLQFHTVGLIPDRLQIHRQRRASGQRDGRPYRAPLFRFLLALLGPSFGLVVLTLFHHALIGEITFAQATVITVHVLAWAAVLWPRPIPVAMSCVLHEVVPYGGSDAHHPDAAAPNDRPPEGALRLNPLRLRRLRSVHHWLVQVRDPRLDSFDDPVRALWPERARPLPLHVLGDAAFDPEPGSQRPQWRSITVRLGGGSDLARLQLHEAQQRRLVVLRAFPPPGRGWRRNLRTYRWESSFPEATLQVVDATTERLELRDGDVLVLSTEGVARAFELEIGAPVYTAGELGQRPAQLEDYVGLP